MQKNFIRFGGAAVLAAGLAFAQTQAAPSTAPRPNAQANHGTAHRNFRQNMRQRMMAELNLTPAQRDQAKSIFQQARQTAQPYRQQLKNNRESLAMAVKTDDNAKIHQLSAERGRLEGQVLAVRSEAMARFYNTLTPAQKAKADQMHQRFVERMQQRWGTHAATRSNS